jgi:hypothetical protein
LSWQCSGWRKDLVIHLKGHYDPLFAEHLVQPLLHNVLVQFDDRKVSYLVASREQPRSLSGTGKQDKNR